MTVETIKTAGEHVIYRVRNGAAVVASWRSPELSADDLTAELERRGISLPEPNMASETPTICVAVTCHKAYLRWLPECIASIEGQANGADQLVLVLDGCKVPKALRLTDRWQVITGKWGTPIPARNAALDATVTDWIVGFDADNVMPDGFLAAYREDLGAASPRVGILYSDLQYTDADLNPTRLQIMPAYDYFDLRQTNAVDTSACWRVAALRAVGGHIATEGLDDWILALAITKAGWACQHASTPPVLMREHDAGRRSCVTVQDPGIDFDIKWKARSLAIVTCLAPDREEVQLRWLRWLQSADLPPDTALYVVDNTAVSRTRQRFFDCVETNGSPRFAHITYIQAPEQLPSPDLLSYHQHVASLYRMAVPLVSEDLVLTLEDDVEPPLDAARTLARDLHADPLIGAVGAVYPMPQSPDRACAALHLTKWSDSPLISELEPRVYKVGFIGGGCTLYPSWALREAMPIESLFGSVARLGWDAVLSYRLRQAGYHVALDPRVVCLHHIHGEIAKGDS